LRGGRVTFTEGVVELVADMDDVGTAEEEGLLTG
jgi:hypothetical protein